LGELDATLGVTENYRTAQKPPVNADLRAGELAWRQHEGGHSWNRLADSWFGGKSANKRNSTPRQESHSKPFVRT